MSSHASRSPAPAPGLAAAAVIMGVMLAILLLSAIPGGSEAPPPAAAPPAAKPPAPRSSSVQSAPSVGLISNNLRLGDILRLGVKAPSGSGVCVLASANDGPSTIGGLSVALGPNWFVLQGLTWLGGGTSTESLFPVPSDPALIGLEFVAQAAAYTPPATLELTNPCVMRVLGAQFVGPKNVLLIKQTTSVIGMTNAEAQGDGLALSLLMFGENVVVVSDAAPADLLDYDAVLDCRFTTTPTDAETAGFATFLKQNGGLFFVCGPWSGCAEGQARAAWINDFLNVTLGVGVLVSSGGNLSGQNVEAVDAGADPAFLWTPSGISGMPYEVTDEGGNFGPPGTAGAGTPWISGLGVFGPLVYGMFFRPSEMTTDYYGGTVAVLFAGGSEALQTTVANPYTSLIFDNLIWFLDR